MSSSKQVQRSSHPLNSDRVAVQAIPDRVATRTWLSSRIGGSETRSDLRGAEQQWRAAPAANDPVNPPSPVSMEWVDSLHFALSALVISGLVYIARCMGWL